MERFITSDYSNTITHAAAVCTEKQSRPISSDTLRVSVCGCVSVRWHQWEPLLGSVPGHKPRSYSSPQGGNAARFLFCLGFYAI